MVVSVVGSFQIYDTIAVTTGGGPVHASRAINVYIFQQAFEQRNFGYAAAMAVILMIFLAGVAFAQNKLLKANQNDLDR
jgi:multiple sugar transport system permease protein